MSVFFVFIFAKVLILINISRMKEYEVGKSYNFWVKGISGKFICLKDDDNRQFSVPIYDFQSEWDWSSSKVPINVLSCYVKEILSDGGLVLRQSMDFLLSALYYEAYYGISKKCVFIVDIVKTIKDTIYYVLTDVYGLKHLYKNDKNKPQLTPGDEVELMVTGIKIKENNKSCLTFESVVDTPLVNVKTKAKVADDSVADVGEFGEENDKTEFKSTIVYPAGATAVDIDTQIKVIVKTIAGFMNADGGKLYIGVNDTGHAVGIENEYQLLNSSQKDKFNYKNNKDGYENKLRNSISSILGNLAEDFIKINFSLHGGHTVCCVEICSANNVIWVDQIYAYKRLGNRTILLRSEAIVKLVLDKNQLHRPEQSKLGPISVKSKEDLIPENLDAPNSNIASTLVPKIDAPLKIRSKGDLKSGKGSFYMNLFENGEWSWSKEIPSDKDLEFCIPINSPASKNNLIMIYEDGYVNKVDAYHLHLEKNEKQRNSKGRRADGIKLLKAFAAKEDDLIACFCEQDNNPHVKVHPLAHISLKSDMYYKGNIVINTTGKQNVKMKDICFVSSEHALRISALMKTENQTSSSIGFNMSNPDNERMLKTSFDTLQAVCDIR